MHWLKYRKDFRGVIHIGQRRTMFPGFSRNLDAAVTFSLRNLTLPLFSRQTRRRRVWSGLVLFIIYNRAV